jgi:general secretion pathway protein G
MKINKKGFTLIELLVVIAIIGLLSTLAVISLNNARQKSRDAKRISDIKQVQTALELYYTDQNGYPTQFGGLNDTNFKCLGSAGLTTAALCGATVYMSQMPGNPSPYDATGATAFYDYRVKTNSIATNDAYSITYYLGAITGGVLAGINTACANGISGCAAQPNY